jgi:hypothetical protein
MVVYVKVNLDVGATGNSASAPRQIRMTDIEKEGCSSHIPEIDNLTCLP